MGIIETAALGAVGGILPDIIKAIRKRFESTPSYIKSSYYWFSVVLLAIIGAVASIAAHAGTAQEALAYGASSFALLTQVVGQTEEKHLGGADEASLIRQIRTWWGS
ncbi:MULTISPECIES: hypothetical protein [Mesorhizobium]|uniref:hypothetical protein n=1 Tax=Mesorhizobium TaxID=68287 RepID=UPI0007ED2AF2|nr:MULTISPECIES: hypothetical protein [Mesorhizobium]TPJ40411.1 hypothetical protein FJ437_26250 [Mesorhizobium sp. B2-6-6]ARP67206.1 hypothetical protein A9K65_030580 [Mesorhizobium sp. WSM1497]MCA0002791.1 hypothetical protein [Mesorhizobium sp. B264B2A]MCA0009058.1 hypothetical protein [Mesorhizobium sp. B264B1B]MCA0014545.1 hypothetical protein [Mesorhizobium sp. B294B1A1]